MHLQHRQARQLVCYGCERPGLLWFLEDCAFAQDGTMVLPDTNGIFWHDTKGYTFLRNAEGVPTCEEDQPFRLKTLPRMHPVEGLVYDLEGKFTLRPGTPDEPSAVLRLFGSFV